MSSPEFGTTPPRCHDRTRWSAQAGAGLCRSLPRRVGPDGSVAGVDASREMIAVAQSKAARRKAPVRFQVAAAQQLPFPNGSFDAV
jgi:ubiquinone/menaquinone biosynthesis C-methylase UbiE